MSEKNPVVEAAIDEAKKLGSKDLGDAKQLVNGGVEPINAIMPKMIDETGKPYPQKKIDDQVDAFIDRQSLGMLTHSLALAMGMDIPTGYTLTQKACEEHLLTLGYRVKRNQGDFTATVEVVGGSYTITDTNRHLAALRALHFLALRHDPDSSEYIRRRLFNELMTPVSSPVDESSSETKH